MTTRYWHRLEIFLTNFSMSIRKVLQDLANEHDIGKWYIIVDEIKYSKFNLVGSI